MLESKRLESLGVMAGGIAHDFNNLLVVILGNADLLSYILPRETPEGKQVLEIENASRRASELCHQLLAFSGSSHFKMEYCDLGELSSEMVQLLKSTLGPTRRLELSIDPTLPKIRVDPTQVRQVLMNLIMNAAEAMEELGGTIQVRVGHRIVQPGYMGPGLDVQQAGRFVTVEVEDHGCGMDDSMVEHIFEPFYSTKFTGRGLGLASMLGVMRTCNGGIRLETEIGVGTKFLLLFPEADQAAAAEGPAPTGQDRSWIAADTSGAALLVDDDPSVRALGTEMLERLGLEVSTAADGEEAVEMLRRNGRDYSVVLLDLTMPEIDGEEAYRQIRELQPELPIVMSSGYSAQDVMERIQEHQDVPFLQKPYSLRELRDALQGVLRG